MFEIEQIKHEQFEVIRIEFFDAFRMLDDRTGEIGVVLKSLELRCVDHKVLQIRSNVVQIEHAKIRQAYFDRFSGFKSRVAYLQDL